MSQSIAAAYKLYLEANGTGIPWYRDGAPLTATGVVGSSWPYGVITEGVGYAAERHGDTEATDRHDGTIELLQVDLYQRARSMPDAAGNTTVLERYDLPPMIDSLLRSRRGIEPFSPFHLYGLTLDGGQRWAPSGNVVRHTWTVRLRRDTKRKP